jgi:hypothetical protein
MARTRSIKPEFWSDEKLARVSRDARLTFIGLWNTSDDYGITKGHPAWLKSQIFPYDEIKIKEFESWLKELENTNRIIRYEVNDEIYYLITHFSDHQKVDHPSKISNPKPPSDILSRESRESSRISRVETERETETETETKSFYSQEFETFWKAYPKKSGSKKAAFDNWKKLNGTLPDIEVILSAISKQTEWRKNANGEFRPEWKDPERWIKNHMWEAELSSDNTEAAREPPSSVISCPKCGARCLKSDLIENGCIYCMNQKEAVQ